MSLIMSADLGKNKTTYMGVLVKVLQTSEGDVIELGAGPTSTPLLHWLCKDMDRRLISYENDPNFYRLARQYRSRIHKIVLVKDWNDVDTKKHRGLVFIDHEPSPRRGIDAIRFKDCADFIVMHDTEREEKYGYDKVWPNFKYSYTWKESSPFVSVVSNFKDPSWLDGQNYRKTNTPKDLLTVHKTMKVAILTANLGDFDAPVDPVPQNLPTGVELAFHRYTDENFPPIAGLTPRLQYRIPKLFGWQMFPGYDVYIWLDGGITFKRSDSVKWYLENLGDADCLFFKHPWRSTIRQESDHVEQKLQQNQAYIVPRYKNGLHKEQLAECLKDPDFVDNALYASTVFAYRNTPKIQEAMKMWWYYQSRYFTVDQISLPYIIYKKNLKINVIRENVFKFIHAGLANHHKKLA